MKRWKEMLVPVKKLYKNTLLNQKYNGASWQIGILAVIDKHLLANVNYMIKKGRCPSNKYISTCMLLDSILV